MGRMKAAVFGVGAAMVIYFIVLPMFWMYMEPDVRVTMPDSWRRDADLPVHVRVSSVHSNVVVREVRATFDYAPEEGQATPYPRILHQAAKRESWGIFEVNRFTFPRSKGIDVVLPIVDLVRTDGVQPGVLRGEIQVTLDYVRGLNRWATVMGRVRAASRTATTRYAVRLE